jgi:hypothetical protein
MCLRASTQWVQTGHPIFPNDSEPGPFRGKDSVKVGEL